MPILHPDSNNIVVNIISRAWPARITPYAYIFSLGSQAASLMRSQRILMENFIPMQHLLTRLQFLTRWSVFCTTLPLIGPVFKITQKSLNILLVRPAGWIIGRVIGPFRSRNYRLQRGNIKNYTVKLGYFEELKTHVFPVFATAIQVWQMIKLYIAIMAVVNWIWFNWVSKTAEPKVIYSVTYLSDRLTLVIPYLPFQPSIIIRIYINRYTIVVFICTVLTAAVGTELLTAILYFRYRGVGFIETVQFIAVAGLNLTFSRFPSIGAAALQSHP